MKVSKKKVAAALGAGAIAAAGSGIAFAYWTSSGNGSGSASTGVASDFVVTTDAATGDPLTPGGPTDTVDYHVNNPSSGYQHLSHVTITVANSDGSEWTSGNCSASDFSLDGGAAGAASSVNKNDDLAPGATHDDSVTIQMVDSGSAQDDCQNVTVPLYVSAS